MASAPFRVAIAGLGTVGAGVVDVFQRNADLLNTRAGRPLEIVAVSARDRSRKRGAHLSRYQWVDNPVSLAKMPGIDVVVELMGGAEGAAYELVEKSLSNGRHVVTANKALMAHHGYELAGIAENAHAGLMFEAAVAGCVPIIRVLRDSFAANRMTAVYGILNGTCNYILTQMREGNRGFDDVLKEAQGKGYAEADPSFDVDGVDTGHKIALLAALAFGVRPDFKSVRATGIRAITAADIRYAWELGYKIKLLGIAHDSNGGIFQSVEPCLVPAASPLGAIEDVYNAIFIAGDFFETPLLSGRGAGAGPTASAVVSDIIDLARGHVVPAFGIPAQALRQAMPLDPGPWRSRYYIRLTVTDKPGVIADVSAILRDHDISIESLLQRGRDPGHAVSVVMTTHEARHADVVAACALIGELPSAADRPSVMRIEDKL